MGVRSLFWSGLLLILPACSTSVFEVAYPPPPAMGDGRDGSLSLVADTAQINTCYPVVSGAEDGLELAVGPLLDVGDILLVHQVQTEFATSGDLSPVGNAAAGVWELTSVADIDAATVHVVPSMKGTYTSAAVSTTGGAHAQACLVPQFEDVVLANGAAVVSQPWDGRTGGIVALLARGTVFLGALSGIDVGGAGFRGGSESGGPLPTCGIAFNDTDASLGGRKGEGLDSRSVRLYGRGNFANGGGGGNAHNAGGGGGGNVGAGGIGGREEGCASPEAATAGLGGASVIVADRLVFGGGGGGGHDDGGAGTAGGNGGGAVFLRASSLEGDGFLGAEGLASLNAGGDGGGGGGAGGTLFVDADLSAFTGALNAFGGDGGNSSQSPGGGGGGGRIRLLPGAPTFATDVTGGDPGDTTSAAGEPGLVDLQEAP